MRMLSNCTVTTYISNGRGMSGVEFAVSLQVWHCLIGVCTQQIRFSLSFVSTFDDSVITILALLII